MLAFHCSPMHVHSAAQASPLLGLDLSAIQSAKPGDTEFVPYVPDQIDKRTRLFLLGDLLTAAGMPDSIPGNGDPVRLEEAEEMLERRIGPPPADWFDPSCYESLDQVRRRVEWQQNLDREANKPAEPLKKPRGRPRKPELLPGGRLVGARRFASTADFLRNARLDDSWIFAKPADRRPYDFIESALEMDFAPWVVMTLAEYLDAVRSDAAADHARDLAADEANEIASWIKPTSA